MRTSRPPNLPQPSRYTHLTHSQSMDAVVAKVRGYEASLLMCQELFFMSKYLLTRTNELVEQRTKENEKKEAVLCVLQAETDAIRGEYDQLQRSIAEHDDEAR